MKLPIPLVPIPMHRYIPLVPIPMHRYIPLVPIPMHRYIPLVPIPMHRYIPLVPIPMHRYIPLVPIPMHRYIPLLPTVGGQNIVCSENTVVFQASIFQYISLAVSLSTGPPYRKPLYTNGEASDGVIIVTDAFILWLALFVLCLVVLSPCNVFLILGPASWVPRLWSLLQMVPHPYLLFRVGVLELAILFMIITLTLEVCMYHHWCSSPLTLDVCMCHHWWSSL